MLGFIDKLLSLIDNRKLKCEVGYQMDDEGLLPTLRKYAERVAAVYFTMPCDPTYYGAWGKSMGEEWKVKVTRFMMDLDAIREIGLSAVVCFDASCYGANYSSTALVDHVVETLQSVSKHIRIKAVTTSSFPVAECLRKMDSTIKIRASEELHFMDVRQLDFTSDVFSGYYIGYESARDLAKIEQMRKWCDEHGNKTLHIVPNNACLYTCPYYIYHGSVQSHEQDFLLDSSKDIERVENADAAPCERIWAKPENRVKMLQGMWIRPEDIRHYAYYFDSMRLATRTNKSLSNIVQAYCDGRWDGNLCDILEAMHEHPASYPVIHNDRFPKDWFKKTSRCGHHCESCHYCEEVLKKVL
ncbi:MAG: hypothetical protein K5787_20235 [Lentisphaeria bacterium]|nr:hypothetical protein [Lentisphaeria bacterium]